MGFLVKKSNFFLKNSGIHEKVHGYGVKLRGYPTISRKFPQLPLVKSDVKRPEILRDFITLVEDEFDDVTDADIGE